MSSKLKYLNVSAGDLLESRNMKKKMNLQIFFHLRFFPLQCKYDSFNDVNFSSEANKKAQSSGKTLGCAIIFLITDDILHITVKKTPYLTFGAW